MGFHSRDGLLGNWGSWHQEMGALMKRAGRERGEDVQLLARARWVKVTWRQILQSTAEARFWGNR